MQYFMDVYYCTAMPLGLEISGGSGGATLSSASNGGSSGQECVVESVAPRSQSDGRGIVPGSHRVVAVNGRSTTTARDVFDAINDAKVRIVVVMVSSSANVLYS